MSVSVGTDLIEIERIRRALVRYARFRERCFTEAERAYCDSRPNPAQSYAGRFAAKEAAMKALGTGWRRGIRWVDLQVVREQSGRPTLALAGEAAKIAAGLGVKRISLSITHTEAQALAQVIFES